MSVERVNYFDRQYLRVEDFKDEQAYQIGMRRRHNISQHSWGIVQGLQLVLIEGSPYITPGIAIDVFGRELVLDTQEQVYSELFGEMDAIKFDVWLEYSTTFTSPPSKGFQTNGGSQFYRVEERPQIRLSRSTAQGTPRVPAGLAPADESFDATKDPPEDRRWPVFLGSIRRDSKNQDAPYKVDLSGRPYAGLVGEGVTSPSGSARVQIGSENPEDPVRFGVFLPADNPQPAIQIEQDGKFTASGETTVNGNLTLNGGSLEIGDTPATSPQPWRIYRVREQEANGKFRNDLRIEMAPDGGEGNRVVFGAWSIKEKKFKPSLTVGSDGTVVVSGNLVVQGRLEVNPENVIAGQLTAEAKSLVSHRALSSMSAAGVATPAPAASWEASLENKMRELAKHLEHPDRLDAFAKLMKEEFGLAASKLKGALEH